MRPPTSIIPGDDARRWHETAADPQTSEIQDTELCRSSTTFCFLTKFLRISSFEGGGGACFLSSMLRSARRTMAAAPLEPKIPARTSRFFGFFFFFFESGLFLTFFFFFGACVQSTSEPDIQRRWRGGHGSAVGRDAPRKFDSCAARCGGHLLIIIGVKP